MTHHVHRSGAVAVFVFGVLVVIGSVKMGLGGLASPGSGLWPFTAAMVTILCGVALLPTDTPGDYEAWTSRSAKAIAGFTALAVFVLVMPFIGVIPAAFALLLLWLRCLAHEPWLLAMILAVIGSVGLYVLFGLFLAVPFPVGVIGQVTGMGFGL